MESLVRLSAVLGRSLASRAGDAVGAVEDVVGRFTDDGYPPVTGVLVQVDGAEMFVPIGAVESVSGAPLVLDRGPEALDEFRRRPGELLLRRDVLGREVIYIGEHRRARLVRAEDIALGAFEGSWRVAGIDVGRGGRWRLWRRRRDQELVFVDWASLEPFVGHVPTARLRLRARRLAQLYPTDIADLVEEASPSEGEEIIEAVGQDEALEADVFEELDREHQLELVAKRSDAEVASLLAHMAPDDAADLLGEIDQDRRGPILAQMPTVQQQRVHRLLGYNPQTAGGLMSPGGLCLGPDATVADALERVRADQDLPETLDTVFVTSPDETLLGAVRILDLVRANPAERLAGIAHGDPPRVATSADVVEVAVMMADYNLATLAVVDDADRVVGVVTVDDVVALLVPENWRRRAEAAGV
jgi:CBS domain-containing protein